MSHHIQFLPQLLPLERPLKPDKKRRLRKTRSGEISYSDEVDDVSEVEEGFSAQAAGSRSPVTSAPQPQDDPGKPIGAALNRATMQALLRAQEES